MAADFPPKMSESQKPESNPPVADEHNAVLVMDGSGRIVEWTPTAEAVFGWASDEAVGRKLSELIIPERFRSMHEAGLKRYMTGGPGAVLNRAIEIAAIDRDGREFEVEVHIRPQKTADGYRFATSARRIQRAQP